MKPRILAFGEILWDIIGEEKHLGGAPLNFAAHVQKCGMDAGIVSCVGIDQLGSLAMEQIEKTGIDMSLILRRNKRTGVVMVQLDEGHPDYEIQENVAYDYIDVGRLNYKQIDKYDHFYFGTLAQRHESSRQTLHRILKNHRFKQIFYDVNLRKGGYTREIIQESLDVCTLFKLSDEELPVLNELLELGCASSDDFSNEIFNMYPSVEIIILTSGGEGSTLYSRSEKIEIQAENIRVADTVGAGDSFSAAFMTTLIKTGDVELAGEVASKVGGFVASQPGAIPEYSDGVLKLLAKAHG